MFKKIDSSKLKGYIIWLPMIRTDNRASADTEANAVSSDSRMTLWWNGDRSIGKAFAKTLGLRCSAWDVYLVYKPDRVWDEGQPPKPDFWMHQLGKHSGADPSLCLNALVLQEQISKAIENAESSSERQTANFQSL